MIPHLAITMGDPAGIGPEIIVRAAQALAPRLAAGEFRLLVVGDVPSLRQAEAMLGQPAIPETRREDEWPALACLQAGDPGGPIITGEIGAPGGRIAYLAIETAVQLAQAGRVQGLVTAPLNKEALNLAGYHYAGHTSFWPN